MFDSKAFSIVLSAALIGCGARSGLSAGDGGRPPPLDSGKAPPIATRQPPHVTVPDAATPECITPPVVERFEPELQWSWDAPDGSRGAIVTPIVGNLTDDDGNGRIDERDTPDVVVVTSGEGGATLWVVDGATGALHFRVPRVQSITPALGDLDGDGVAEIVTLDASLNLLIVRRNGATEVHGNRSGWDPLESTCRHASLSIL